MPFIPLDDDVPRLRIGAPWITWGLIAACLVVVIAVNNPEYES